MRVPLYFPGDKDTATPREHYFCLETSEGTSRLF